MKKFDLREGEPRIHAGILTRVVSPRPIALVSSISGDGRINLAPFSYFNLGGANPPSVVFSVLNDRHGREKDTLLNVGETGEYTISVVTRRMADAMNLASASFPRGVSEYEQVGFSPVPSALVKPPRVGESPIAMECRLYRIVPHGEGPLAGHYIIGEVLLVHASESVLDQNGQIDPTKVDFIGRLGADYYAHAAGEALFVLPRPQGPTR